MKPNLDRFSQPMGFGDDAPGDATNDYVGACCPGCGSIGNEYGFPCLSYYFNGFVQSDRCKELEDEAVEIETIHRIGHNSTMNTFASPVRGLSRRYLEQMASAGLAF